MGPPGFGSQSLTTPGAGEVSANKTPVQTVTYISI